MVKAAWSPATVAKGGQIFETTCSVCHGGTARSSGVLPDLRRSPVLANQQLWQDVVHDGALKQNGMVGFSKWLSRDDVEAVRAYVAGRSQVLADKGI